MEKRLLNLISFLLTPLTKKFFKKLGKNEYVNKTVNLYPNKTFVKIRFWDAPFIEVEKIVPSNGKILDLGCGEGIFTNYMAISSGKRKIIGVELDRSRIAQADKGLKNVKFTNADVLKQDFPRVDVVVMFHLLHHLTSFESQEELFKKLVKKITKGGKLIIVEAEKEFSYKYFLAFFTDHFLVPLLFEKKWYSPIFFRTSQQWRNFIESLGFSCKIKAISQGKPFSHVVLVCKKIISLSLFF